MADLNIDMDLDLFRFLFLVFLLFLYDFLEYKRSKRGICIPPPPPNTNTPSDLIFIASLMHTYNSAALNLVSSPNAANIGSLSLANAVAAHAVKKGLSL